jgi:hypothetical protein
MVKTTLFGLFGETTGPLRAKRGITAAMPGSSIGFTSWFRILAAISIQGKLTLAKGFRNLF